MGAPDLFGATADERQVLTLLARRRRKITPSSRRICASGPVGAAS
jgi:hypothetical protein